MDIFSIEGEFESRLRISSKLLRVCLGAVASNLHSKNPMPVWLLIVGSSGRTKTATLDLLSNIPRVMSITDCTPQSWLSGWVSGKKGSGYGILQRIQKGVHYVILIRDMSQVLTLHSDLQNRLFSLWRDVFDGYVSRPYGNKLGTVEWYGKIGILGAVTDQIDRHHNARQQFGSRFLYYRIERESISEDVNLTINSIVTAKGDKEFREKMKIEISNLIANLKNCELTIPAELVRKISHLALVGAYGRSFVLRDPYRRDILDQPDFETGTRLGKELCLLGMGLAMVCGENMISKENFDILRKVAVDSIPRPRRSVLRVLCEKSPIRLRDLSNTLNLPESSTLTVLEDLKSIGFAECGSEWRVSGELENLTRGAGLSEPKDLWI